MASHGRRGARCCHGRSQVAFHDWPAQSRRPSAYRHRIVAYYRLNSLQPQRGRCGTRHDARFDVRSRRASPSWETLTGADWDVLFAFRNLFYDDEEALLDEVASSNPPKRVLGGISVRF